MTFLTCWSEILNPVATNIYIYIPNLFRHIIHYADILPCICYHHPKEIVINIWDQQIVLELWYSFLCIPFFTIYPWYLGAEGRGVEGGGGGANKRSYFPLLTQMINNFLFIVLYMITCSNFSHIKRLLHFSFFSNSHGKLRFKIVKRNFKSQSLNKKIKFKKYN